MSFYLGVSLPKKRDKTGLQGTVQALDAIGYVSSWPRKNPFPPMLYVYVVAGAFCIILGSFCILYTVSPLPMVQLCHLTGLLKFLNAKLWKHCAFGRSIWIRAVGCSALQQSLDTACLMLPYTCWQYREKKRM